MLSMSRFSSACVVDDDLSPRCKSRLRGIVVRVASNAAALFPSLRVPSLGNERLQTIRDVLCFTPPLKPPHLYKFFQFSKYHLTLCQLSKIDQMRKTRCVKAYSFAGVLSLEVSKSNTHFYVF